jgi:hypothetical protein
MVSGWEWDEEKGSVISSLRRLPCTAAHDYHFDSALG